MFRRLQLDTTAHTWCSSTAQASSRLEGRRAGWAASSTLPSNSAACRHLTSCWHTDPGSSHSSTSRSDTAPTHTMSLTMHLSLSFAHNLSSYNNDIWFDILDSCLSCHNWKYSEQQNTWHICFKGEAVGEKVHEWEWIHTKVANKLSYLQWYV